MCQLHAHLHLEIALASEPISGEVTGPWGEAHRFSGWIELTEAIEDARLARGGDCERPALRAGSGRNLLAEVARQWPGTSRRGD